MTDLVEKLTICEFQLQIDVINVVITVCQKVDIEKGEFWPVEGGNGGVCKNCNRLRLTSDGRLFPCLFSNISFPVKELGVKNAVNLAVNHKPESGQSANNKFYSLGG